MPPAAGRGSVAAAVMQEPSLLLPRPSELVTAMLRLQGLLQLSPRTVALLLMHCPSLLEVSGADPRGLAASASALFSLLQLQPEAATGLVLLPRRCTVLLLQPADRLLDRYSLLVQALQLQQLAASQLAGLLQAMPQLLLPDSKPLTQLAQLAQLLTGIVGVCPSGVMCMCVPLRRGVCVPLRRDACV